MRHNKSADQIEKELRQEFETTYKERLLNMKTFYEIRYQSLHDTIHSATNKILSDGLLDTMAHDRHTSAYTQGIVKQLYGQIVAHQREIIFEKMGLQINELKFNLGDYKNKYEKLKFEREDFQKDCQTERLTHEQVKNGVNEELIKAKDEAHEWKLSVKNLQTQLKKQQHLIESLNKVNSNLQEQMAKIDKKMSLVQEESHVKFSNKGKQLEKYKMTCKELDRKLKENELSFKEYKESHDRKYKQKKQEHKVKIDEYKDLIQKMRSEREKKDNASRMVDGTKSSSQLQKKIYQMMKQNEKKVHELKTSKDRERNDLEKKYENKIRDLQSYYEKLLQGKISEVEQNTQNYIAKLRDEEQQLRKYLDDYQKNYLPLYEHEEEVGNYQLLLAKLSSSTQQLQKQNKCFENKIAQDNLKIVDLQNKRAEIMDRLSQLEDVNGQLINKIKNYEQNINFLRINQKKNKSTFEELEKSIKKQRESGEEAKRNVIKMEDEMKDQGNLLRERERKIKQMNEEQQQYERKVKRIQEHLQSANKEKETFSHESLALKKEHSSMEYKLKEQEHRHTLEIANLESKLNHTQNQLKNSLAQAKQLGQKLQGYQSELQSSQKQCFELQNKIKRVQSENQFYREAKETHKNDTISMGEELKKSMQQKQEKIQYLQGEMESVSKKCRSLQEMRQKEQQLLRKEKKSMRVAVMRLQKVILSKTEALRKECFEQKQYLRSMAIIVQNEEIILSSTLAKHLIQHQFKIEQEKQALAKKQKERTSRENQEEVRNLRQEYENKIHALMDKYESEIKGLSKEMREKEKHADELLTQHKRLSYEAKKETLSKAEIEKEKSHLENKMAQQKQSFENKISEVIKQFKEEKDAIVKQYEGKKDLMEEEVAELKKSLKKIKSQMENIRETHEEEKCQINHQLRTVKEQQEAIQKVYHQKQQEATKRQRQFQLLMEAKQYFEGQLRLMVEELALKKQGIQELQLKENQISGELNLAKNKCDRSLEENSELRRLLKQRQEEADEHLKGKIHLEAELRDIRGAIQRSNKNQELRALNHLSMETVELSNKVNQMKKISGMLENKTPMRS